MSRRLRLAIVDDHPLMRDGIVLAASREPDFDVVASGGSADDAISIAKEKRPDIMLVDVNMPGGGLHAARAIAAMHPQVLILFLTVSENPEDVAEAFAAGVRGYILKGISSVDLIATIRSVVAGCTYITPEFAAHLLSRSRQSSGSISEASLLQRLTFREEQILGFIKLGLTNKEIARELDVSEKTVKRSVSRVLRKLRVRNRVEAAGS
jgi:DNA-binding NarL/FixJ family response regulator